MSAAAVALCRIGSAQTGVFASPLAGLKSFCNFRLLHNRTADVAEHSGRAFPQSKASPISAAGAGTGDDKQAADRAFLRGRWTYVSLLGVAAAAALAYRAFREPVVTQRVFLDFEVDGQPAGSVVVGLFGREAPRTCENFAALASHERGFGYRGCSVHWVARGWSVWSGDVTEGNGRGGVSVFGPSFGAETLDVRHRRGSVSMVLDEKGRLRSQFFFTLVTTPGLNRKAAAFGRVLEGLEVLERLSNLPTIAEGDAVGGRPRAEVRVRDSGVLLKEETGAGTGWGVVYPPGVTRA